MKVWIHDFTDPECRPRALDLPGSASELHWSPSGDLLAVALAPTSLIDDKYTSRKVCLVNPETGELAYRADNPGKLGEFAWSPNGERLAFVLATDQHDPAAGRLAVVASNGGEYQIIVGEYDGQVRRIAWTDAETILYLSEEGVHSAIRSIRYDGTGPKLLLDDPRPVFTKMSLSGDKSRLALLGSSFDFPDEVFGLTLSDPKPVRLTVSNDWLASRQFGRQEVVEYEARDGLKLQGLLMHPLNEETGKRYPLILQVHGGPESHRRDGWLTYYGSPGQAAAARGFAVFYPNYRGSTGRGITFSKMGQGDYAGPEFDDLVDAVDNLVKSGLVDRDRVGITGGSYGGYASAWGATAQSEHFAASVMGYGVSDLISKFGTTDIPEEMHLVHALSYPWERWQWMLEQSPIYHAGESKTPTLILHGDSDPRVHPSQSLELYRYLKAYGQAPVRMVSYPGEKHGNRKAAARYDYSLRQMRWLEHYLLGPGGEPPPYEVDYSALK